MSEMVIVRVNIVPAINMVTGNGTHLRAGKIFELRA